MQVGSVQIGSVQVRPLADGDFFPWLGLYAEYAKFYDTELTDDKALLLWSWLIDKNRKIDGVVAVDDQGNLVGLAHFREFLRPLEGDFALYLDDLFVAEGSRGAGIGGALLQRVKQIGHDSGAAMVTWMTAADNETAQKLYDTVATRTKWVTYEMSV